MNINMREIEHDYFNRWLITGIKCYIIVYVIKLKKDRSPQLELEAYCPSLSLYFNKRLANYEARLQYMGMATKTTQTCAGTGKKVRIRKTSKGTNKLILDKAKRAKAWTKSTTPQEATIRDWKQQWQAHNKIPNKAADKPMEKAFQGAHLQLHNNRMKAQSAILSEARTGKINLKACIF